MTTQRDIDGPGHCSPTAPSDAPVVDSRSKPLTNLAVRVRRRGERQMPLFLKLAASAPPSRAFAGSLLLNPNRPSSPPPPRPVR